MNINDPANSRTLAILIQNIDGKDRDQFLQDAKDSPNMGEFMRNVARYKTIPTPK